jgi:CubicO group peptidase (beta-lactamase class C family)
MLLLLSSIATADERLGMAVDAYLAGPVKERKFSGVVLVARDGKPLVRKAYGFADWTKQTPVTPETGFMIFSVSKQFTAALILRLQDQGKLSVGDPVARHVPNWPKEWEAVTVHHLLSHSAGIDIDTLYFWLIKHHPEYWEDPAREMPAYAPKPLLSKPGTTFRYSNAGYTVLTRIAAKIGGKPFAELMRDEVFHPLGMRHTGLEGTVTAPPRARGHRRTDKGMEISEQKTHYVRGAGDVVSTLDDLLRWDEALYGEGLLSASARRAMFTPTVRGKQGGFGYGWLLRDMPDGQPLPVFSGSGAGFTAYVIRLSDRHLYVAVLSNLDSDGPFPYGLGVLNAVKAMLE